MKLSSAGMLGGLGAGISKSGDMVFSAGMQQYKAEVDAAMAERAEERRMAMSRTLNEETRANTKADRVEAKQERLDEEARLLKNKQEMGVAIDAEFNRLYGDKKLSEAEALRLRSAIADKLGDDKRATGLLSQHKAVIDQQNANTKENQEKTDRSALHGGSKGAPADVATVEWMMTNGMVKDRNEGWEKVRSLKSMSDELSQRQFEQKLVLAGTYSKEEISEFSSQFYPKNKTAKGEESVPGAAVDFSKYVPKK